MVPVQERMVHDDTLENVIDSNTYLRRTLRWAKVRHMTDSLAFIAGMDFQFAKDR